MSYTKVKKIEYNDHGQELIMTAASSNLLPIRYYRSTSNYYSNIWRAEGKSAMEKELLVSFWAGELQGSGNKFHIKAKKLRELFPWGDSSYQQVRDYISSNFKL